MTLEDVLEETLGSHSNSFVSSFAPRIVGEIYDPDEEKDEVERQQNQAKIQQPLGLVRKV